MKQNLNDEVGSGNASSLIIYYHNRNNPKSLPRSANSCNFSEKRKKKVVPFKTQSILFSNILLDVITIYNSVIDHILFLKLIINFWHWNTVLNLNLSFKNLFFSFWFLSFFLRIITFPSIKNLTLHVDTLLIDLLYNHVLFIL